MADFSRYFAQDVKNTLLMKNGVNFYHKGPWTSIYTNTEIDRWYVGDFASANYHISVEFNSNKKETLSVLVVARPDQANLIVYGRVAIDDEMVDVSAVVVNSYLSLRLSAKIDYYKGVKAIYSASYAGSISQLSPSKGLTYLVTDTSPSSGGGSSSSSTIVDLSGVVTDIVPINNGNNDIGKSVKRWKDLYLSGTLNINGAIVGTGSVANSVDLPTGSSIGGTTVTSFSRVAISGQVNVNAVGLNDTLTFIAGTGISFATDATARTVTINSSGGGAATSSSASSSGFGVITVAGQSNIISSRATDSIQFVAGTNISLATNPTTKAITISATGGGGGGGGGSSIIVSPVTTGVFPMVLSSGADNISPQSLYAQASVTLNAATGVMSVIATQSQWADLAENYLADSAYEPGTVLEFGGDNEVTIASDETRRIAGVVSTQPSHLMNTGLVGDTVVAVALQGRVPCKVRGKIRKGDMLVSGGGGYARPSLDPKMGSVIGKALENFEGASGVIEVVVGRL
jgi:hypothetical protein